MLIPWSKYVKGKKRKEGNNQAIRISKALIFGLKIRLKLVVLCSQISWSIILIWDC
jgi:hypothetical protein